MRYTLIREHVFSYLTPSNFNYLWSFGPLVGLFLAMQLISGTLVAMHYTPYTEQAFSSIEHLMRDVEAGWIFRYLHANGASFVFIFLFLHIAKGLYYTSFFFPYGNLWRVGMILFLLMMATAFLGYVLPWGQMSYWGATVITNLFTAIPQLGYYIVQLLWGGFAVDNATLNRFFSIHFILPIIIVVIVLLHLSLLHLSGSSHPAKIEDSWDKIPFYIYFYLKDLVGFLFVFIFFCFFVFFFPNVLGHSDNYIMADALSTPTHIVPEWYFLPFYAILRSIPNKLGGVLMMFMSILIVFFLPTFFLVFRKKFQINTGLWLLNARYRPLWLLLFWCFCGVVIILGWIGQMVVEDPFILIGFCVMILYFFILLVLVPFIFYQELDLILHYMKIMRYRRERSFFITLVGW